MPVKIITIAILVPFKKLNTCVKLLIADFPPQYIKDRNVIPIEVPG